MLKTSATSGKGEALFLNFCQFNLMKTHQNPLQRNAVYAVFICHYDLLKIISITLLSLYFSNAKP